MKYLFFVLLMAFSSMSFAENFHFSAFTGVQVCGNHEGTGNRESCMVHLNYEPNVEFNSIPAELTLDHSQYGLNIHTKITLTKNNNNTVYKTGLKVESLDPSTGKYFVNPVSINIKDMGSLGIIRVMGDKLCRNEACQEWLVPFIYLGPAFTQEKINSFK